MALHAVIDPQALKSFTRTLACFSRYGDDVLIQANPDALILSATNSAKSAFCRVKLKPAYFVQYTLKPSIQPGMSFQTPPEAEPVIGQLLVKALLSIFKHKTVEKMVDRCDLFISDGGQDSADASDGEEDSLSSRLTLRLHCKHGVVKTHRLLLFTPNTLLFPKIPATSSSNLTVGPGTLRDLLENFPHSRGDPRLAWNFAANDVVLRNSETGRARDQQLCTEISLSADEFDTFEIGDPPVSISFFLREFNATITLAEYLSVRLHMRFTSPAEPLIITFDTESADAEYVFMISTKHKETGGMRNANKRSRGDDNGDAGGTNKFMRTTSNTASARTSQTPAAPVMQAVSASQAMPNEPFQEDKAATQQSSADPKASQNAHRQPLFLPGSSQVVHPSSARRRTPEIPSREPLFLPGASQDPALPPPASQLSAADLALISSSGLGIEHMDYEEFEAMMEAEGEEVGMSTAVRDIPREVEEEESMEEDGDQLGTPMQASQAPVGRFGNREFRPLFDD